MIFIYAQSINSLTMIYDSNDMVKPNIFINEGFHRGNNESLRTKKIMF